MNLQGKRALVTGAGSGSGAAIARALARQGAEVVICGRQPGPLEALAKDHPLMRPQICDVTSEASVEAAFAAAGPLDIVVANAGISASAPLARTSLAEFQAQIDTNLLGTFLTFREAARHLPPRSWGRVIAIASTAAVKGYAYVAPYAASKHGVLGLVRSAALEYARKGVTFNALCPGFMDTEMTRRSVERISATTARSPEEARETLAANSPQRRLIDPEEVAEAVLWLCGPGSGGITGQAIPICGGETA
ncbi:SDR family NAD(P)-dependent oxidoreductase [Falsigemmobacter faecalis]|uniref:SDR family oxidoreductase n=1 Tax=Falsigemmobacter faecalis TaxID=2488730 RepID=A0A3P3D7G0_9RHOB|nr:SDR family NAD(P)-dependent oxidoreductase [Falsigemmobacter faecalis]RRH70091.1 SDR family oxidoreductase [Falsigemmobacter faecalis]